MGFTRTLFAFLGAFFTPHAALAAENPALRQQLAVLERSVKKPCLRLMDRLFWICLSKVWRGWRSCLAMVKPETVTAWHRKGFKLYWRWKSRKAGRPEIDPEIRNLIRRISLENPTWGAPRIQSELALFGLRGGRIDGIELHGASEKAGLPDLASLPCQPRGLPRLHRLLHRADRDVSRPVLFCHIVPSSPASGLLQRHDPSHQWLDNAADCRSVSL